jgi:hypothetical protein
LKSPSKEAEAKDYNLYRLSLDSPTCAPY